MNPTQTTSSTSPANPNVTPVVNKILTGVGTELDKPAPVFNKPLWSGPGQMTKRGQQELLWASQLSPLQDTNSMAWDNAQDVIGGTGLVNGQDNDLAAVRSIANAYTQPGSVERNFADVANGAYLTGGNPYFEQNLQRSLDDATAQYTASLGSSGRLGSQLNATTLADSLGALSSRERGAQYETERDRQLQAATAVDAAGLARLTGQQGALGQAFGMGQQGLANQMAATAQIPGLYENSLAPAKMRLQIGQMKDAERQAKLQAEYDLFSRQNNAQSDNLAKFAAILGGTAPYGGTSSTMPGPSLLQTLLGAGAVGGGIYKDIWGQ